MQKRSYITNCIYLLMLSFFLSALNYACTDKGKNEEFKADILLDRQYIEIFQGEEVYFSCEAVGGQPPYIYSWNFGVGIPSSSLKIPGFIAFRFEGTTKVALIVKDSRGITREDFVYVNVKNKFDLSSNVLN